MSTNMIYIELKVLQKHVNPNYGADINHKLSCLESKFVLYNITYFDLAPEGWVTLTCVIVSQYFEPPAF